MLANIRQIPRRKRALNQKGQAMLESALTLSSMLLVILGTLDVGQVFMQLHFLNDRARTAARWASVHTYNVDQIKNYVVYGSPAPASNASRIFGLRTSDVSVTRREIGTASEHIEVRITRPVRFFSPYLPSSWTPPSAAASSPVESLGATE